MKKNGKSSIVKKQGRYGYLFITPFFIAFLTFGLYPVLYTLYLSFQSWDGLYAVKPAGVNNCTRLLSDKVFYLSLWNSFRIWIVNFIPQMLTALLLSAIFTFHNIKGMKYLRAAYYLPNLITAASMGLLFHLLFNGRKSVINHILVLLNIPGASFHFFNRSPFTSTIVSYIQWWMWFGYTTVIIMAGITTIDAAVKDAALIDRASKPQIYFHITLPLIKPTLIYLSITFLIGGMQLFNVPATLSNGNGDPRKAVLTPSMYLYNQSFRNHHYGYALAITVGLFLIIGILSLFSFAAQKKKGENTS